MRLTSIFSATLALVSVSLLPVPSLAQSTSGDSLMRARSNCLTAVAKVVGLPRTTLGVIKEKSDPSGSSVDVKVPKATAPWACLTDRQGKVEKVYFKGSEGAL
jgi:hypothetical protein